MSRVGGRRVGKGQKVEVEVFPRDMRKVYSAGGEKKNGGGFGANLPLIGESLLMQ